MVICPDSKWSEFFVLIGHFPNHHRSKAETVDEDAGDERMPTARQRSQRSSAPSAVRFMKRCLLPESSTKE